MPFVHGGVTVINCIQCDYTVPAVQWH